MLACQSFSLPSSEIFACPNDGLLTKKKRRPAGTPDPDAEVVYLSPEMLMESDRYVCEICNQCFQREQNLQMHRRRHKVPWKLLKKDKQEVKKRVYVCPEPTCLHHDPCHALGDLVGIKKHFRRKHSNNKQWVCEKCSKGYAVQSDYKAHVKICGTRGHSCDCGRVFSRVEAFIEHQDTCKARMTDYMCQGIPAADPFHHSTLSPDFLGDRSFHNNLSEMPRQKVLDSAFDGQNNNGTVTGFCHNLELELFSSSNSSLSGVNFSNTGSVASEQNHHTSQSTIGSFIPEPETEGDYSNSVWYNYDAWNHSYYRESMDAKVMPPEAVRLRDEARELSRVAKEEKALAEEKRHQAKCLIEMAKQEMTRARTIREQAFYEFNAAELMKDCATRHISSNFVQITCNACRRDFIQEKPSQLRVPSHLPF
ncbi:protein indeterminate-domain 14 [Coffea arabica]|uniref:Protein indeterminate-domain 14 n=1 Tax=Coffea arabica TaxID=13443 RepID=A0A6P6TGK6_COFAR|nr:protein indeterminate-domain 16-like isoform X1 [Coffea arabica]